MLSLLPGVASRKRAPINVARSKAGACRDCGGTGDTLLGRATCSTCHGSGYHLRRWDWHACPQCGGPLEQLAEELGVPMPCRACRGKAVAS